jgi:SPP1 gp7 family putative phage head morphogenesis protein
MRLTMPTTAKGRRLARVGVKVRASLKAARSSSRKSALKLDPTRTIGLRKAFVRELRKRFATIRRNIRLKIIDGDALGLKPIMNAFCPTGVGGGIDPSCSSSEGHIQGTGTSEADRKTVEGWGGERAKVGLDALEAVTYSSSDEAEFHLTYRDQAGKLSGIVTAGHNPAQPGMLEISYLAAAPGSKNGDRLMLAMFEKASDLREGVYLNARGESSKFYKHWKPSRVSGSEHFWSARQVSRIVSGQVRNAATPQVSNAHDWRFQPNSEKIKAFQSWLRQEFQREFKNRNVNDLWQRYAEEGFKKGAARAFDDTTKKERATTQDSSFYQGGKEQFLRSSFRQPANVEAIKVLAGRSFNELEGVTDDMAVKMTRTLADGLVQGKNPKDIGADLDDQLDLGQSRSETIARTEIIRAHAEGQLKAFEDLGVTELGVEVEWSTAEDELVCPQCDALEGIVIPIDEAHGMLPRHPNCRCSWIPANVGEDDKGSEDR